MDLYDILLKVVIFGIPLLLAVPLHEAAHGFAALYFGDQTAKWAGRLTLNPFRHIDLFGTIFMPAALIFTGSPFIFGYAKPVPVDAQRMQNPRRDMAFVALAGPLTNIVLAIISGLLVHIAVKASHPWNQIFVEMLNVSIMLNVSLAIFNMLPIPPLDGGRVAVGILPEPFSSWLAQIESYGMYIVFGLAIVLPLIGEMLHIPLNILSWLIGKPVHQGVEAIATLTGIN